MKNAIHYFNQNSSGMIFSGQKDGSDELGIFYTGTHHELEMLRELINESIDLLRSRKTYMGIAEYTHNVYYVK